nr:BofC C-terminal domain-containing protein [Paenibacillus shirakamiensis]
MSVHLIKVYKCGEETQSLGRLKGSEIIDRLKQHPTWQGRIDQQGEVWLESPVNDLSEACKRRGYMGLDAEGNLSLFDGPPQDRNVIHTFFQMDMERIESSLPEKVVNQLKQGIRIQDVEEYNSVISTFSDYAKEQTQKVMQQHR